MRAIERALRKHWIEGIPCSIDNSAVTVRFDSDAFPRRKIVSLVLFGNVIAERIEEENGNTVTRFTLAGWNTTTTRSRLTNVVGASVSNVRGRPCSRIGEIETTKWYSLESA